jgi:CheY-like chemotaxis protein
LIFFGGFSFLPATVPESAHNEQLFNKRKQNAMDRRNTETPFVVLVVEDHPDFRDYLVTSLEDFGCHVLQASHGMEALDLLQVSRVDLILSDLEMPVMDGANLLLEVRKDSDSAGSYFVLLTGRLEVTQLKVAADEVLHKPIYYEQLEALVDRVKRRNTV